MVLALIDRLTSNTGCTVAIHNQAVKVPGRFIGYFPPHYETENFAFFDRVARPGITCFDIGAHIGVHAVYMVKKSNAQVISFEPTPALHPVFYKIAELNKTKANSTLIPAAIGETSGKAIFYLNTSRTIEKDNIRTAEANSLVHVDFGDTVNQQQFEVNTYSIDDFAAMHHLRPHFIKIDAEGAEAGILKGAGNTMRNDRPSGILSLHTFAYSNKEETLAEIWNLLADYRLLVLSHNKKLTPDAFMEMGKAVIFDVQFVAAERAAFKQDIFQHLI
jgi:FkbM family methyltransferase